LRQTASLPGTWRLTRLDAGRVELLGEVCEPANGPRELAGDAIDAALEELGLAWKRREANWVVPASARCPQEVVLSVREDQLRVESVLVSWDEIGEEEHQALAWFLCRAQAALRFGRCELEEERAIVAGQLQSGEVEVGLTHVLGSVLAASRALGRPVAALLQPGLAGAYLGFLTNGSEILAGVSRI
jgi:hypothetical protein